MDPADAAEWLLVIDMQRAFGDPGSAWFTPGFATILPRVERLVAAYAGRTVLTRYVAPRVPSGAWRDYFRRHASFRLPPTDPAWDLLLPGAEQCPVETRDTFGKWDDRLAARVGPGARIAVCGVATECCVLATVLGALDAGRPVRVLADACAGASERLHTQALAVMAAFAPMVEIVDGGSLCGQLEAC